MSLGGALDDQAVAPCGKLAEGQEFKIKRHWCEWPSAQRSGHTEAV